jgi:hypothetical protein
MNAKTYCKVTGTILLILGVLGWFWPGLPGILSLDQHFGQWLNLLAGVVALWVGTTASGGKFAALCARVYGIGYLLSVIVGLIRPFLPYGLHLDPGSNLIHLGLGAFGIWAGFFPAPEPAAPAA